MRRALLLVPLLLLGCGEQRSPSAVEGTSTAESGRPCVAAPAVDTPLPQGFPEPPPSSVLTAVSGSSVSGRVEAPIEAVVAHFTAAFDRAGYVVQREEDEGRAVRLGFFGGSRGDASLDVATLTCPSGSTGFTMTVRTAAG